MNNLKQILKELRNVFDSTMVVHFKGDEVIGIVLDSTSYLLDEYTDHLINCMESSMGLIKDDNLFFENEEYITHEIASLYKYIDVEEGKRFFVRDNMFYMQDKEPVEYERLPEAVKEITQGILGANWELLNTLITGIRYRKNIMFTSNISSQNLVELALYTKERGLLVLKDIEDNNNEVIYVQNFLWTFATRIIDDIEGKIKIARESGRIEEMKAVFKDLVIPPFMGKESLEFKQMFESLKRLIDYKDDFNN